MLALQGISWMTRKLLGMATLTLDVKQWEGPPSPPSEAAGPATHIEIAQTLTGGLKGTTENRCLDWVFREHEDYMFGRVEGRSRWIAVADVDDAFLAAGWEEGDAERAGPNGETHLLSHVESRDNTWIARQIWGFQIVDGARRYARNVVVTKGDERVQIRLVYDYSE